MGANNNKPEVKKEPKFDEPIDLVIWFDKHIESKANQDYLNFMKLYFVDHKIYTFSDVLELKKFVYFVEETKKILLITSGSAGEDLLHEVYNTDKIAKVVIFCYNTAKYKQVSSHFKKVVAVESEFKNLLKSLADHVQTRVHQEGDLDVGFHFNDEEAFIDYSYLNFVIKLAQHEDTINSKQAERDLVIFSKAYLLQQKYKTEEKKKFLEDFKQFVNDLKNDKDRIIYWYTKVSFINKMVNTILRRGDLIEIFHIRHFIFLLTESLNKINEKLKSPIEGENKIFEKPSKLFRGTRIKKEEFKIWEEESVGKPILLNGFASTSEDMTVATKFVNKKKDTSEPVLMEINISDEFKDHIYPIMSNSDFEQEKEYLLGVNELIIVKSITPIMNNDELDYYYISANLTSIDELPLQKTKSLLKTQIANANKFLETKHTLDVFYLAELFLNSKHKNKLFDLLLNFDNILTKDLNDRSLYYTYMGHYYDSVEDYNKSIESYTSCLTIYESISGSDHPEQLRQTIDRIKELEKKREAAKSKSG